MPSLAKLSQTLLEVNLEGASEYRISEANKIPIKLGENISRIGELKFGIKNIKVVIRAKIKNRNL